MTTVKKIGQTLIYCLIYKCFVIRRIIWGTFDTAVFSYFSDANFPPFVSKCLNLFCLHCFCTIVQVGGIDLHNPKSPPCTYNMNKD